jgi:phytoene desaturase
MPERPTAVIVGAGLGGIATAGRLARAGYQVTVLEKNAGPGGRCDQLVRDGHRFDLGPTLFLMPEVFAATYADLGERMEAHLDLRRIDPTYRIYFDDGVRLELTSNINAMQPQLEAIEPGSFGGFLRYLAEGQQHYRVSLERFVGRDFDSLLDYFHPANLPLLFRLKALKKHYSNVGNYFTNPHLKAAFTFQDMYLGLSPYDAPATYSLLQYTELADGVWFPMGGLYAVIASLVAIAEKQGARFVYNAPVAQIELADGRATGVLLENGERIAADVVIANADLPYVYRHLLPDSDLADRIDRKKFTCSTITFYWGVDKIYPQLDHHNVFLASDYQGSFQRIFEEHTLPDQPSFYVHAPARTDPDAAPAGQDTLMVLVPAGHLDEQADQDVDALRERARASVLRRLSAELGIDDLKDRIKFEVAYTARDWRDRYNLAKGAAFGLSHNFTQVGYLRPRNQHPRYRNLYFTGSSTHPGTGLPIVLLSARLTTERVLRDAGYPVPQRQPVSPAPVSAATLAQTGRE